MRKFILLSVLFPFLTFITMEASLGASLDSCIKYPPPLPADTKVVQPSEKVPVEFTLFSGMFSGPWESGVCHTLVVKNVRPDGSIKAIYSWHRYWPEGEENKGYRHVNGTIRKKGPLYVLETPIGTEPGQDYYIVGWARYTMYGGDSTVLSGIFKGYNALHGVQGSFQRVSTTQDALVKN